jgi:hypothetical protein
MKPVIFVLLVAAALSTAAPLVVQAAEEDPIVALIGAIAEKPENHQAIAAYYRTVAAEARADVTKHEAMRVKYRHFHPNFKSGGDSNAAMSRHCEKLIKNFQSTAEEYDSLAKLHEAEAAK